MPRRRKGVPPQLKHHKASGQGYVSIDKQQIYLGPFGSAECRREYRAVLQRWEEDQRARTAERSATLYLGRGATVKQLVEAFLREAAPQRYQMDGELTSTFATNRTYLNALSKQFGMLLADEFRHPDFEVFRQSYSRQGYSRGTIKKIVSCVLVVFRWGHKRGAVSAETLTSLAVSPEADEGEERDPVGPVAPEKLAQLLVFLRQAPSRKGANATSRQRLAAMLEIQSLVGMRPGELCRLRPCELRQDGTVQIGRNVVQLTNDAGENYAGWVFQPARHKTKKRGRTIAYLVGPQARLLLQPLLPADPLAYVWAGRRPGHHLTYLGYYWLLDKTCAEAGIERFTANQLRHSCLTRYAAIGGIEKASHIASHSSIDTTLIYAERNLSAVVPLVEAYG